VDSAHRWTVDSFESLSLTKSIGNRETGTASLKKKAIALDKYLFDIPKT
jgi:hypothetical protein